MDLSVVLSDWPYDEREEANNVRKVMGLDGRVKLQMRVRNGVLQWEVRGRPDGRRPHGHPSALAYCRFLVALAESDSSQEGAHRPLLNAELAEELTQELFDFYRRGRSLFLLGDYGRAMRDMSHCLNVLRILREGYADEQAVVTYDRHRPSLLAERARCAMLLRLQRGDVRGALDALNQAIRDVESFYEDYELPDQAGDSSERQMLVDLRRSLREKHNVPLNDEELLQSLTVEQEVAIRRENYEMAARLRDKINSLRQKIASKD